MIDHCPLIDPKYIYMNEVNFVIYVSGQKNIQRRATWQITQKDAINKGCSY